LKSKCFKNRTNPLVPDPPDTDLDGMLDPWEITHRLDPQTHDSDRDPDHDGFTNLEEYRNGTNPQVADLSGDYDTDGMPDIWETRHGLNLYYDYDSAQDRDKDGLTNLQEFQIDTNPNVADTDSDGRPDGWEVSYSLNPHKNDAALNPDADSYTNLVEYKNGTNPNVADPLDTDLDRMPDAWETSNNLDPQTHDSDRDPDHDGFTNLEEYRNGTNPRVASIVYDFDSDGMPDHWENRHGLIPYLSYDNALNPDEDLLADGTPFTNLMEFRSDTNPNSRDTDSDRLPDGWEVSYSFNPRSGEGEDGSGGDPDGDNLKNSSEFLKRTNPRLADTDGDGINDMLDAIENVGSNASGSTDTDGDGLTDAQEQNLGTSIYLADTNMDGIDDHTAYASGKDPADPDPDSDGDGIPDGVSYWIQLKKTYRWRKTDEGKTQYGGVVSPYRYLTETRSNLNYYRGFGNRANYDSEDTQISTYFKNGKPCGSEQKSHIVTPIESIPKPFYVRGYAQQFINHVEQPIINTPIEFVSDETLLSDIVK
jgi:hypothetical protein